MVRGEGRAGELPPLADVPALAAHLAAGGGPAIEQMLAALAAAFAREEPRVRAFVPEAGRWERLRRDARRLLSRFSDPDHRPPLFGVPLGVKDIFHVRGLPTRAGSDLPPEELSGQEAEAVAALRRAGALVVGKTATTEFAYFAPGPTRNPHDPGHTPGGSSSGSAAAVSCGLAAVALGTQTIGSLGRPAAYCGVVGFKPTYRRNSRAGVIPLAPSLDHVGFFTATISAALAVAPHLLAGWRPRVARQPGPRPVVGIPEGPYLARATVEGASHFGRAVARLEAAGWDVRPIPLFGDLDAMEARHRLLLAAECARVHRRWYPRYGDRYRRETRELIERGLAVAAPQLRAARAGRRALREQLRATMAREGIGLWASPGATGPAPAGLAATGDPMMSLPWTQAGLPAVTVPAGRNAAGLPLGLQVAGDHGEDERLLAWAAPIAEAVADA